LWVITSIQPVADTYAFCLLPNHFHLLAEIKDLTGLHGGTNLTGLRDLSGFKSASQTFSNLFNAYAKAINKAYGRTGPLFERPFKRIPVTDRDYFARLLIYIHQNPQRHGLIEDYRAWPYSSYGVFTGEGATFVYPSRSQIAPYANAGSVICDRGIIKRDVAREWFGDVGELRFALQRHHALHRAHEPED
jgi:REP element-mobilizing transposase RayT